MCEYHENTEELDSLSEIRFVIGETVHPDYRFRIFNFLDARYIQETISEWYVHNCNTQ